jgi:RimJ/RimL family protein N-acetyltransferase
MELFESGEVFSQLSSPTFQKFWDQLYADCPWKTGFQSRAFVQKWYEQYQAEYEPLLIFSEDSSCRALLPLAVRGRKLVVAGDHQAEYQAWLAQEGNESFLTQALQLLRKRVEFDALSFKYLPPGFPVQILTGDSIEVRSFPRPLMRVNPPDKIAESLKKKSNKSRLNGLKRRGDLTLEHVKDAHRLSEFIEDMIVMYDFRQGAVNGSLPFEEDPQKKAFHLALADLPNLLHCSVLRLGERAIATQIGICSGDTVQLGVFAYSPLLGEFSPGKLHLLLLGLKLQEEGFMFLDLTPGGDEWKERFATEHDTVHIATIYRSPAELRRQMAAQRARQYVKRLALKAGFTTLQARTYWSQLKRFRPGKLSRRLRFWLSHHAEFRVYRMAAADARNLPRRSSTDKDNIRHLLAFHPTEAWQTRRDFLSVALRRMESGKHHVYSRMENGQLVHNGWLIERQEKSFFTEVQQEFEFPKNSAVLYDFYTHPNFRGKGYYSSSLLQMLHDAASIPGTEYIYISVLADNHPSRHVIEKLGFLYEGSLYHNRRLGKSTKWSSMAGREEAPIESEAAHL